MDKSVGCDRGQDQGQQQIPNLKPGFASEEEIDEAKKIIVEKLAEVLDGKKYNAVVVAFIRLSGEMEP